MATTTLFPIAGWSCQAAVNGQYTVNASDTGNEIRAETAGLFARTFKGSGWSKPDANDTGVKAKDLPTDGSLKIILRGTNAESATVNPVPRWAVFNRTTNTGYLIDPAVALAYPSIPSGPYDLTVNVDPASITTAITKAGVSADDDIEMHIIMKVPQGVMTDVRLTWETADTPIAPVTVERPEVLRRWDGSKEVPLAVDALSGPPAWKIQDAAPFQVVPAAHGFIDRGATDPLRIMTFGDSQTAGTSADAEGAQTPGLNSWPNLLATRLGASGQTRLTADALTSESVNGTAAQQPTAGVKVINCGFGGATSANFMPVNARTLATNFAPQISIIQIGVNDCLTSASISDFKVNLVGAIDHLLTCTDDGVVVVLTTWEAATMRGRANTWAEYRTAMREAVDARPDRVVYVDTASWYQAAGTDKMTADGLFVEDRLHFTAWGHKVHAALVSQALGVPDLAAPVATGGGAGSDVDLSAYLTLDAASATYAAKDLLTQETSAREALDTRVQALEAAPAAAGWITVKEGESVPSGTPAGTLVIRTQA